MCIIQGSTATLHFGRHQTIWECRNKIISEYNSQVQSYHTTHTLAFEFGKYLSGVPPQPGRYQTAIPMASGKQVVECFFRTRITIATVRFPAICGVASLSKHTIIDADNVFIAGLWSAFLYWQLLWVYDQMDETGLPFPPVKNLVWVPRGWRPRLPSWSWISVDYPVRSMAADEMRTMLTIVSIQKAHNQLHKLCQGVHCQSGARPLIRKARLWGRQRRPRNSLRQS
jgi:hypothetical protein